MKEFPLGLKFDSEQIEKLNKVILQSGFNDRVDEVRKINLSVIQKPTISQVEIPFATSSVNSILDIIDEIDCYDLDAENGSKFAKSVCIGGYDESKYKFLSLEGEAHITTHAIDYFVNEDNIPICTITFYFYTRSKQILNNSKYIKFSDDISNQTNLDYALDRNHMINYYSLENSLLFIDGPLIGGNITHYSLELIEKLHSRNIIPIFIVKNSFSNLIVENIENLRNKFNSDLHWAYKLLNEGQRTNFFRYTDKHNKKFSKIFCYAKPFNYITPQRIEFHPSTFSLYQNYISGIFDLIYYLLLLHGDKKNPQMRPIAIAEMYAREVMQTINIELLMRRSSLTQTMDQSRFGE